MIKPMVFKFVPKCIVIIQNTNLFIALQWQLADQELGWLGQEGALYPGFGIPDHPAGHCTQVSYKLYCSINQRY